MALTELQKTILWVEGRLDELTQEGMIEGGKTILAEKGKQEYQALKTEGWQPDPDDLIDVCEHAGLPPMVAILIAARDG